MLTLKPNETKKKAIHKEILRNSKLSLIRKATVAIWLLVDVITLAFYLTNENADWFLGGILLAIINISGPFLYIIAKIATWRISGANLSERVNESLIFDGSTFEYGYQNFAGRSPEDRVIIKMPIDRIRSVRIDRKELTFTGEFCQMYYNNFITGETQAQEKYLDSTVVLFDYFEPSLIEVIKERAGKKVEIAL